MAKEKDVADENVLVNLENQNIDLNQTSLMERVLYVINEIRISKNGKNTFSNYEYFKPEEINKRVNPLLLKYKIFPLYKTFFQPYEIEVTEYLGDEPRTVTKQELKEIAELRFKDVLKKDEDIIYQMPIERIDIKGANKMQNLGGVRTYSKRYLYMEALNISNDDLDLDSTTMSDKSKAKSSSKDTKVGTVINKIQLKIEALRKAGKSDSDIATTIRGVYQDGGKPSANYKTCEDVGVAQTILEALDRAFGEEV